MSECTEEAIKQIFADDMPVSTTSIVQGECVAIWYEEADRIDIVFKDKVHIGVDEETHDINEIPSHWSDLYVNALRKVASLI